MIYVIGSGPTGVATAAALLGRKEQVTMLDAGFVLEPERRQIVHQLAQGKPADWPAASLARMKDGFSATGAGIPLKYSYGSDFPYRDTDRWLPQDAAGVGLLPSLAQGGLSNVWGGAVLPYLPAELAAWPITFEQLAPHYQAVLAWMGLSARHDDLAELFPLCHERPEPLPISRQADGLLQDLQRHRQELRSRGIWFGSSRLAVLANDPGHVPCAKCGLCMYGCPYGLIYNSQSTLERLRQDPGFSYRGGVIVERFAESAGRVQISVRSVADGQRSVLDGSRLYVGAGVLSSTRLVLESAGSPDRPLTLRDSQYFLLPLVRYRRTRGVAQEPLHTLAQVFLEIFDRELSEHSVHLQIYGYNDLFLQAMQSTLGRAAAVMRPIIGQFLERFLLIQGYLHSDLSATIEVSLEKGPAGQPGRLRLTPRLNPRTRGVLKKLVRKLRSSRSLLRALPLRPLMKVGEPGRGFHSGGTLPMSASPGPFETDVLGRPHGFERVHIVDSSVFPTINASTITLTAMANAHRIASAHDAGRN
ncbi:MAG TPA: GMC oxidoreductase [Pirellulales bacterium]|jgi:choline dehydrogenase-like flavoprotein|nr:GMC oxidoreductase [Pirellulales bacterium]